MAPFWGLRKGLIKYFINPPSTHIVQLFVCHATCWSLRSWKKKHWLVVPNAHSCMHGSVQASWNMTNPNNVSILSKENSLQNDLATNVQHQVWFPQTFCWSATSKTATWCKKCLLGDGPVITRRISVAGWIPLMLYSQAELQWSFWKALPQSSEPAS